MMAQTSQLDSASPLDILPLEIWEQIFLQASPEPSHFKPIGFNMTEFVEYDPKVVLRLSQISRFLRQLVVSCPILWTCLPSLPDLYRPEHSGVTYFRNRFRLIDLFIERAQALSFHVTFTDDMYSHQMKKGYGWYLPPHGIQSFFATSSRWKSLTIYFMDEGVLVKYAHDLVSCSKSNPLLPTLDTLAIRQHKTNMTYLENPISIFMSAPKLKHIHFIGMDIDNLFTLPWNQITTYNGALQQFTLLGAAANSVQELVLKRNFQYFQNPTTTTKPFRFTKLTRLNFDNINFLHKLPKDYGAWRNDGTVLRCIEAPLLRSLEITTYQILREAPSIVNDLTMSLLRFPHDNLRNIVFHVGGLTRQSLADLLHSTPHLDTLDLWAPSSGALSALKVNPREGIPHIGILALAPKLRYIIVREWQDSNAESLSEIFDSRRTGVVAKGGVSPLERIDLVYQKYKNYKKAQDSIEGWGEERQRVYRPGSDYQKIHGYSTHLVKEFLVKELKTNPRYYGVGCPYMSLSAWNVDERYRRYVVQRGVALIR